MAAGDATLALPQFPAGTSVSAYLGANDRGAKVAGSAAATVTTDASLTASFTGLNGGRSYFVTDAPTNEVQTLTVSATAGQFRLRYGTSTTHELAYNIAASDLQIALRALGSINGANVSVSGGPGDSGGTTPYVISFIGSFAAQPVSLLEVRDGATALSGGGATATIARTTPGRAGYSQRIDFVPVTA